MPDAYVAPQRRPDLGDGPSALNPGDRAVRIGAGIVFLSLVSAFATYLILTGLTPIPPRGEVVLIVLFVNVVLIVAMIGLLTWQVDRALRVRGASASPARACTSASLRCSASSRPCRRCC